VPPASPVLLRTALSLVNLGALTATLVVWFSYPQFSTIALYLCLGWVLVAFGVMYSRWGNRPLRTAPLAPPGPRLPGGGGAAGAPLGFCVFCAAHLAPGMTRCPDCGRAIAA